jgi:hypothetical protein
VSTWLRLPKTPVAKGHRFEHIKGGVGTGCRVNALLLNRMQVVKEYPHENFRSRKTYFLTEKELS